jgi:hypothetical protein
MSYFAFDILGWKEFAICAASWQEAVMVASGLAGSESAIRNFRECSESEMLSIRA